MTRQIKLGWKRDIEDTRDVRARLPRAPVPARVDNKYLVVDILDQGGLSSCVANAGMQAVRASHVLQLSAECPLDVARDHSELGSRMFGYYCARAYSHETAIDGGTYIRDFFRGLQKFGFCPERVYPYDDGPTGFARMPPTIAFRAAFDQVSPVRYQSIAEEGAARVDMAKRALASGHLVVFGTDVTDDFCYATDPSHAPWEAPPDAPPSPIAGGHAMCLVGYSGDSFEVVNSWGPGWGDSGYCRITSGYLAWEGTRDLWIVSHAPMYTEV